VWIVFVGLVFAAAAEYACKMSILFFYRRIFFVSSGHRKASLALIIISTIWFIVGPIAVVSMCHPIQAYFADGLEICTDWGHMLLPMLAIDAVIDLAILLLPIRMVFKLQLPRKTKVGIAGVFALGGFVMITSIIRMMNLYYRADPNGISTLSRQP
jgi:hypothetical protein